MPNKDPDDPNVNRSKMEENKGDSLSTFNTHPESSVDTPDVMLHLDKMCRKDKLTPEELMRRESTVTLTDVTFSGLSSISMNKNEESNRISNNTENTGTGIWSKILQKSEDAWHDNGFEDTDDASTTEMSCARSMTIITISLINETRHFIASCFKHPIILISSVVLFLALSCAGIIVLRMLDDQIKRESSNEVAHVMANLVEKQFLGALLPLIHLQVGVIMNTRLGNLPKEISSTSIDLSRTGDNETYRDVSGICDDDDVIGNFTEVMDYIHNVNIKDSGNYSMLNEVVLNYKLAPQGVLCVTENTLPRKTRKLNGNIFKPKSHHPSRPQPPMSPIGLDLTLSNKAIWKAHLQQIFEMPNIQFFPPNDKMIICAHVAVNHPGFNVTYNSTTYSSWGMVMSEIDLIKLIEYTGISDHFKEKNMEFRLRLKKKLDDQKTQESFKKLKIANSSDFDHLDNSYTFEIPTMPGHFIFEIAYKEGYRSRWYIPFCVGIVIASLIFSVMFKHLLIDRVMYKKLLYKVMPESAIVKLRRGQTVVEKFNLVTIFFSDIVGFTSMAGEMRPIQVMKMLNELYTSFDSIVAKHGVYKVETIGDAYMVVGGAPNRMSAREAAEKVALFALEAVEFVKKFKTPEGGQIYIRTGIATGPAVAGVVGKTMPRYCFFGNTVNLAARMEQTSKKMKIQCSDMTYSLLNDSPNYFFDMEERQENNSVGVEMKGNGLTHTWWINNAADINANIDIESGHAKILKPFRNTCQEADIDTQYSATSCQNWSKLGQDEGPLVAASAYKNVMIDRITAILEMRLALVLLSRKQTSLDTVTKKRDQSICCSD